MPGVTDASDGQFSIIWMDSGRTPEQLADPAYPDGVDLNDVDPGVDACRTKLSYPAKRVGAFLARCTKCGIRVAVTTAGRRDDPRSVVVPCRIGGASAP